MNNNNKKYIFHSSKLSIILFSTYLSSLNINRMSPKVPTHNPLYVDDLPNLHADAIVFSDATTYGA